MGNYIVYRSHIITIKCLSSRKVRKTEASNFKVMSHVQGNPKFCNENTELNLCLIHKACFKKKNPNSSLEICVMKTRVKEFPGTDESSQANFSCLAQYHKFVSNIQHLLLRYFLVKFGQP